MKFVSSDIKGKWMSFFKERNNLIVLVLIGVLLMVIVIPVPGTSKEKNTDTKSQGEVNSEQSSSLLESSLSKSGTDTLAASATSTNMTDSNVYVMELEGKMEQCLSLVEGAGKVKVLITLETSEEKIVEKDQPVIRSNTDENDSAGGSRTINEVELQETTIFTEEGNNAQPFIVKTMTPKVEGVIVVASGAGKGTVSKELSEAVQVLLGIEANRVKILRMKE